MTNVECGETVSSATPALKQRVSYLEQGQRDIWQSLKDFERGVEEKLEKISKKLDQKTTINWAPIGILITAGGIILTLFVNSQLAQSRDVQNKHDSAIKEIRAEMVMRSEHDRAWSIELERDRDIQALLRKQAEERAQLASDLAYLRGQLHPQTLSRPADSSASKPPSP